MMETGKHSVEHVALKTRIGWGFGGLSIGFMTNTLNVLFLILYADYLKMPPVLAGLALALPRLIDSIADPLIGNFSDNAKTRWGRRKPFMVAGLLSAVLLPLFWVPIGVDTVTQAVWYRNIPFLYVAVLGMVYAFVYALYDVPYTALGYELTNDYDERTRILAWRMYIGLISSMIVPLLYQFCQWDVFGNVLTGARWASILIGVIIIGTGILPVLFTKEHKKVQEQETIHFLKAIWYTLSNIPFLILLVAYIIIIIGLFSAGNLGMFLNIYYVCGANKDFAGVLCSVVGVFGAIMSYFSMFLIAAVSHRLSKKHGMMLGLLLALISAIGSWWTLDPRWPLLQLVTMAFATLGLQGCWLMVSSMVADICDEDELKSGLRREGMFGAVNGFALKAALALTALIGGILLQYSGFSAEAQRRFIDQTRDKYIGSVTQLAGRLEEVRQNGALSESGKSVLAFQQGEFTPAVQKFCALADDKAAPDGNKFTVFFRLLKGAPVYFTLYDFERTALKMQTQLQTLQSSAGLSADVQSVLMDATVAQQVFLDEFGRQKAVSQLMKKLIVVFQSVGLVVALITLSFYPISRERAAKTRRILDERKQLVAVPIASAINPG
jgi:GPH family glycoside/pentoside/hexuronide:cation symporter